MKLYEGSIGSWYLVEQVREIVADTALSPIQADKKIYILDRVDQLGASAANAFLKTLEEPADDVVMIRRINDSRLEGESPERVRHFMEIRGVGIINARRIFGMGSVKMTEKVDMVISLEQWDKTKVYDRMGMTNEYMEIMGIKVPSLTIPVKTGRNLAVIIEVAAMNNRQKKMGYNAAQELLRQLGMTEDLPPETVKKDDDDLY